MSIFKQQVYKPYLTTLLQHLDSRFPDVALLEAFGIFDPVIMEKETVSDLLEKLKLLTAHYGPHVIDPDSTVGEYQCFVRSVLSTPHLKALTHDLMSTYSTLGHVPQFRQTAIALVIPMSIADCERVFSALNRIKTNLQNRLSCKILNALMTFDCRT